MSPTDPPFARQGLGGALESVHDAVETMCGLNAQTPRAPSVALHERVAGFRQEELDAELRDYRLVKANLMRGTVFMVSSDQYRRWRTALQPALVRAVKGFFPRLLGELGEDAVVEAGTDLLAGQPDGLTRAEIGRLMAPRFPEMDPAALAFGVRMLVPVVQLADDTVWRPGRTKYLLAAVVLPGGLGDAESGLQSLLSTYLRSCGPATVADASYFTGLTQLAGPISTVATRSSGEGAATRWDVESKAGAVPDAFVLPEYDNALFARKDGPSREARRTLQRPGAQMRGSLWRASTLVGTWQHTSQEGLTAVYLAGWDDKAERRYRGFEDWYRSTNNAR